MEPPADKTATDPQGGPERSKKVITPVIDDLAEAFQWMEDAAAEITRLENEIKKLQNAPPNAGAGGGGTIEGTTSVLAWIVVQGGGETPTYTAEDHEVVVLV